MWTGDTSQGGLSIFPTNSDNIYQARNKQIQLLNNNFYYFLQVCTLEIELTVLSSEDIVPLDDLFDIISFVCREAIQIINNDKEVRGIYVQNKVIPNKEKYQIFISLDLYYTWMFFGYGQLHNSLPFYSFLE